MVDAAGGNEEARSRVPEALPGGSPPLLFLNLVNLGEVFYITVRKKGLNEAKKLVQALKVGPVTLTEVSEPLVMAAAALKARHAISYADAFAVATAQAKGTPLLTGDPELAAFPGLRIIWIGRG